MHLYFKEYIKNAIELKGIDWQRVIDQNAVVWRKYSVYSKQNISFALVYAISGQPL